MNKNAAIIVCLCASFGATNHNAAANDPPQPVYPSLQQTKYRRIELPTKTHFGSILFRTDSDEIEQVQWPILRSAIVFAAKHPNLIIVLEGYSDVRGSRNHNRSLSTKRVRSVAKFFIRNGIAKERIRTFAYGESRAGINIKDTGGYLFDRRVTIKLSRPDISV